MSIDKQIEEMAYEMTQYKEPVCKRIEDNKCLLRFHAHAFVDCHFCKLAEHLITEKSYRKSTELARETVDAIKNEVRKKEQYVNDLFGYGGYVIATTDLEDIIRRYIFDTYEEAELKKKYTESEK